MLYTLIVIGIILIIGVKMNKTGILMENILQKTDIPADALRPIPELETTEDIDLSDESLSYVLANKLNQSLDNLTPIAKELTGYGQLAEETNIKYVGPYIGEKVYYADCYFDSVLKGALRVEDVSSIQISRSAASYTIIDGKVYYFPNGTDETYNSLENCSYVNNTFFIENGAIYQKDGSLYSNVANFKLIETLGQSTTINVLTLSAEDIATPSWYFFAVSTDGKLWVSKATNTTYNDFVEKTDSPTTFSFVSSNILYSVSSFQSLLLPEDNSGIYYINKNLNIYGPISGTEGTTQISPNAYVVTKASSENWIGFIKDGALYRMNHKTKEITLVDDTNTWKKPFPMITSATFGLCLTEDGKLYSMTQENGLQLLSENCQHCCTEEDWRISNTSSYGPQALINGTPYYVTGGTSLVEFGTSSAKNVSMITGGIRGCVVIREENS